MVIYVPVDKKLRIYESEANDDSNYALIFMVKGTLN